ncbi:MAG: hypothetical protein WKF47_13800 [Geodermatophilaceae bacterium]
MRVPATSANLGPGFDTLGLALQLYDEVTVEVTDAGLDIDVVGAGAAEVPRDESHLVVRALRTVAERLGGQPPGIRLRARNAHPARPRDWARPQPPWSPACSPRGRCTRAGRGCCRTVSYSRSPRFSRDTRTTSRPACWAA